MPEQEWEIVGAEYAVLGGEVGMANTAGQNPHQRFARPGMGDQEVLDNSGFAWLVGDDAARGNRIGHAENLLVLLSIW